MKARLLIEAVWTPHVDPEDFPEDVLQDHAEQLQASPEALVEFLDRDEVIVTVTGEWA